MANGRIVAAWTFTCFVCVAMGDFAWHLVAQRNERSHDTLCTPPCGFKYGKTCIVHGSTCIKYHICNLFMVFAVIFSRTLAVVDGKIQKCLRLYTVYNVKKELGKIFDNGSSNVMFVQSASTKRAPHQKESHFPFLTSARPSICVCN